MSNSIIPMLIAWPLGGIIGYCLGGFIKSKPTDKINIKVIHGQYLEAVNKDGIWKINNVVIYDKSIVNN